MSVQMSQIRMSQVEEEQKGHNKKKAPPLSNGGSVTNVSKQNGDRSRSRSEKRKGNKKGAEMEDESVGSLTCKICQCVFCDEDDKLIECGRCEKWECINCSNMSEKQYDMLNDKSLGVRLHWWFCNECNTLAISAVKTDKEIGEKFRQYFHEVREEIQETRTVLDQRITSEVSSLREDIKKLNKDMTINSDPKLREEIEIIKKDMKEHEENLKDRIDEKMNDATTVCLDEFSEREGRKLNIMLFNVPESEKKDPEEKKKDDLEFLRILMAEIKLTVPFSQVIRIGVAEKTHSKPMPMRPRTTCITDQRKITKAASILKDTEDYKDMYIKRDETPLERAQTKNLNVLRESRTEESRKKGENVRWFIRRGQVVNGKPRPGGAEGGGQS